MAGSGFPPLPNIPYCCLPQESGPCLSTSVGDRPLRSPSHRRLGGPSPRQPSNGTHARPPPRRRFPAAGMPPPRRIGYHPPFPGAVPTGRVGCIRVTHPSATLKAPEGASPVRLACIRPAASVHPEPGSNSSLYYCLSSFFSLSRVPPSPADASLRPPASLVPYPAPPPLAAGPSCAGLRLSKSSQTSRLSRLPLSVCGCKSTTFFLPRNDFSQKIYINQRISLTSNMKKFT